MARAGIVASVQPCHLLADIAIAKRHWPKAQRYAFPLRSMLSAGVTLAGGSDVPIETLDPRRSVFAAAVRTDEDGVPAGGWFPQQRLRAPEAIDAFTRGAATAAGLPPPAGTLAPGAAADLTVWADDPFRVAPSDLLRIGIRGCMVGGRLHLRPNS
jgi:predicted amidohydrolase YtcJ